MDFSFLLLPGGYLRMFHTLLWVAASVGVGCVHFMTRDPYKPLTQDQAKWVYRIHWSMVGILFTLWVTGAILIWNIRASEPWTVPKVQFKIGVVGVLTVNAFLMHHYLIHELSRPSFVLGQMSWRFQARAVLLGSNSMASWMTAAILGFGREWNSLARIPELATVYGAGFTLLVMAGGAHLYFARRRQRRRYPIPAHERVQPLTAVDPWNLEIERLAYRDTVAGEA